MVKKVRAAEVVAAAKPHRKPASPRRRKPRGMLLLLSLLLAFGLVVWFLPLMMASSSLLGWMATRAARDLNGSVRIGGASLGWLSPVVFTDVEILDAQGNSVLQASRVTGNQRLMNLLLDRRRLGVFRVEQPQLNVVLRADGSNVEDLLARYLSRDSSEPTEVSLEVVEGRMSIQEAAGGRTWAIEALQMALQTSADHAVPLKVHVAGAVADALNPGQFDVALEVPSRTASESGRRLAVIDAQGLSAEMFAPLLARFAPGWQCAGRLSPKLRCAWGASGSDAGVVVDGGLSAEQLVVASPALGSDQVRLDRLETVCQAELSGDHAVVTQFKARCDVGEVSLSGTLVVGQLLRLKSLDDLRRQSFDLSGQVDIASLARMLPTTMHIQQATEIVSGKVQATVASRHSDQGMVWDGRLEAADLKAVRNGRSLAWDQPVLVVFTVSDTTGGMVVNKLQCRSTFLNVEGSGTAERMTATGQFDLGQLAGQLEQFVDLRGVRLAGQGSGEVEWKREGLENYEANLRFQLRDFRLARPDQEPWTEQNLVLSLNSTGATDFRNEARIDTATLEAESGPDRIEARLTAPVGYFANGGTWPLEIVARGRLEGWQPRLKSWVAVDTWKPSGAFELTGKVSVGQDRVRFDQARLGLSQFAIVGPSVSIQEPSVTVVFSGGWDRPGRQVWLPQGSLASAGLTVTATDLKLAMPTQGPFALTGVVKYQGQLEHLRQWIPGLAPDSGWRLAGEISGDGQFQQSARLTTAVLNAKIDNLTLVRAKDGQQFAERQIAFLAKGEYDGQSRVLDVQQFDLGSSIVAGSVKGRVTPGQKQPNVDFAGTVQYDLDRVCGMLRPYLDPQTRFTGRGSSPASLRGPMSLAELQGEMALEWATGFIRGFRLGPARLKVNLAGGLLRTEQIVMDVSEGKVRLSPIIRLTATPCDLVIEPGLVADQIRVDPVMGENALLFGIPVLAGAATADGRFSVQLNSCRVPLDNPRLVEMNGQMTVHTLHVSPGFLIRELVTGLGLSGSVSMKQQSVIPFEVRDGRVYHQNMELTFSDLAVRSSGSVGLDRSLNLITEVSLPKQLLGNNPVSTILQTPAIRVPIGGTLEHPTLNHDMLGEIGRQTITGAAQSLLETTKQLLPIPQK